MIGAKSALTIFNMLHEQSKTEEKNLRISNETSV